MEILFFIIGVFIFGLGMYLVYDHWNYVQVAMETSGKIIGFKISRGSKGHRMYTPVVESYFGDFSPNYSSSSPSYEIGERIDVIYVAGKEPRIKSSMPYVFGAILMLFGGLFCFIFLSVFSFTLWHVAKSLIVLGIIAFSIRKILKKNGIDSLEELKDKMAKSQQDFEDSKKGMITEKAEMQKLIMPQKKSAKFVGPLFAAVGIGVMGLGVYLGIQRYEFLEKAISASGEIVDFHESRSEDSYTYYPIVEYSPSGTFDAIRFRHDSGSNPPSYRKGERVSILHLPDDPAQAIIDNGIFNWATSLFVICFGLLFASAGIGVTFSAYKRNKKMGLSTNTI